MPAETVASLLSWSRMRLTEHGVDTPALDSRLLLQHATSFSHEALIAEPDRPVGGRKRRGSGCSSIGGAGASRFPEFLVTGSFTDEIFGLDPRPSIRGRTRKHSLRRPSRFSQITGAGHS